MCAASTITWFVLQRYSLQEGMGILEWLLFIISDACKLEIVLSIRTYDLVSSQKVASALISEVSAPSFHLLMKTDLNLCK